MQFFWVELIFASLTTTFAIAIYYFVAKGTPTADLKDSSQSLTVITEYLSSRFQSAISLMLGFYTSILYTRWWEIRVLEGVVIGRINDIAPQIAAFIRDGPLYEKEKSDEAGKSKEEPLFERTPIETSFNDEGANNIKVSPFSASKGQERMYSCTGAQEIRMHLVRWLNLAHALAVGDLYEKKPNEFASLEHLKDCGLLNDKEYTYMLNNSRSRYVAPFVWFLNLVNELKDRGECGVDGHTIFILSSNITRIRGSLADLYMYRNVPVPLAYRQLVNITVRSYMLLVILRWMALIVNDADGTWDTDYVEGHIFWAVLPFTFEYFVFVGWITLADALGNPFRYWADAFEWENYVRTVSLSSNLFITESRDASTSVVDLKQSTQSVLEKQRIALSKWKTYHDDHDDPMVGVQEIVHRDEAKRGFIRIRKRATGH